MINKKFKLEDSSYLHYTSLGQGLYLTVFPKLSTITDSIYFLRIDTVKSYIGFQGKVKLEELILSRGYFSPYAL